MITINITRTQEKALNKYVDEHMNNCYEWMYQSEDDAPIEVIDEFGNPFQPFDIFCGCNTCIQREILHSAFRFLEENKIMKLDADE